MAGKRSGGPLGCCDAVVQESLVSCKWCSSSDSGVQVRASRCLGGDLDADPSWVLHKCREVRAWAPVAPSYIAYTTLVSP